MAEKTYAVMNGAAPGAAAPVAITTGTSIRTMLQLATNTTTPAIRFVEWWVEFDGSTAATPIKVELLRHTATPQTTLTADGGFGVKWEKNPGFDVKTSAVVTSGDRFEFKLSPTSTITQSVAAIWDASDWGDALYTFGAGVAAALTTRSQLKLELLDAYATRPPTAAVKNNDVAVLAAVVYKF